MECTLSVPIVKLYVGLAGGLSLSLPSAATVSMGSALPFLCLWDVSRLGLSSAALWCFFGVRGFGSAAPQCRCGAYSTGSGAYLLSNRLGLGTSASPTTVARERHLSSVPLYWPSLARASHAGCRRVGHCFVLQSRSYACEICQGDGAPLSYVIQLLLEGWYPVCWCEVTATRVNDLQSLNGVTEVCDWRDIES